MLSTMASSQIVTDCFGSLDAFCHIIIVDGVKYSLS